MKRIAILFACTLCTLALTTCENEQLITLLKAPSELKSLEIVAYAGDTQLEGGAAMEPGFTTSVFNYTVYVSKDTDRFTVNAAINGNGTIEIMCEEDQETGTEFDYRDDEPKVMILTVEREYMEEAEYRVTVVREGTVPTATGVEISVTPGIGAFFLGRGVLPEFEVTAHLPSAGGVLSYQWYMNTQNSSRGGSRINGATGTTYKMRRGETLIARTVYYYAEITNTINGKTGITESLPCRVTFLDKNELHEKSWSENYMVTIPAGTVNSWDFYLPPGDTVSKSLDGLDTPWSTPGFSMGKYLVTWELWKYVFDHAEAGNYSFANIGNQGAEEYTNSSTNTNPQPVGNELNPVSMISWRDAVVWCNAYSEMDGRQPVYVDSEGNVFRDSREPVDLLVDESKITGKNGYRLPTYGEWMYAMRGANPQNAAPWTDRFAGTNTTSEVPKYVWSQAAANVGQTIEVGKLMLPNDIGLYDMLGMVYQWVWGAGAGAGKDFSGNIFSAASPFMEVAFPYSITIPKALGRTDETFYGLRLVRDKE